MARAVIHRRTLEFNMTQTGVKNSGSHNSPLGLDIVHCHIRGGLCDATPSKQSREASLQTERAFQGAEGPGEEPLRWVIDRARG